MADVFRREEKKIEKSERKSVVALRKLLGKTGSDSVLSSFSTFPTKVNFETQDEGEEVVLFLRQHPIVNVPWIILVIFALTIPSVFGFFPMIADLPGTYQFVLELMWYSLVFGFALAKFMSWFFNIYILTDERVVDVDFINLFYRVVSTAKIEEIQDLSVRSSGAFETFFNYGSVFIQTAAQVSEFEFLRVPRPDVVAKVINQMIDQEEQEKLDGRVK